MSLATELFLHSRLVFFWEWPYLSLARIILDLHSLLNGYHLLLNPLAFAKIFIFCWQTPSRQRMLFLAISVARDYTEFLIKVLDSPRILSSHSIYVLWICNADLCFLDFLLSFLFEVLLRYILFFVFTLCSCFLVSAHSSKLHKIYFQRKP